MKVLVVDDSLEKRTHVLQVLKEKIRGFNPEFDESADYEETLRKLGENFYDVIILDLRLPAAGAPPSEDTSRSLIRQLIQGSVLFPPTHVIGLTAYKDVVVQESQFYQSNLLGLEYYDRDDLTWGDRIANRLSYLARSQHAAMVRQHQVYDFDLVVLVARFDNEYVPIKKVLFSRVQSNSHPLWNGELSIGEIKIGRERTLKTALICVGEMGMAPTAAVASMAISAFRPRLVAMLGMCCGFAVDECAHPRKYLDIVVARQVACWEEGKYFATDPNSNDFRNRSKPRSVDDAIRDEVDRLIEGASSYIVPRLRRVAETTSFRAAVAGLKADTFRPIPDVKYASIVSGSSVIADEEKVRTIISRHSSAIGLDMELFGLYVASERSSGRRPSVLGIKGVADFGHSEKDDVAQSEASRLSAEVFKCIVANLSIFK